MRILRACLSALNHIQRHDQLVPAGHRRQIHIRTGLVPGHPGTANRRLQNACAFLKRAFQLFGQVKLHIGLRIRSDHRQQERVDPLLNHLQIRPQAFRIQRPGIVFAGGVGLRIRMPDQRRIDPIRSCNRLPAQLDRFGPLLFSETGREWFDLHPILQQRYGSGIAATRSPCLAECSHPFFPRLVIPFLDVFRSDDLRVEASGGSPQLFPESPGLDLFLQRLPECAYRRDIPAGIARRIGGKSHKLCPRNLNRSCAGCRDGDSAGRVTVRLFRPCDPVGRNDPDLPPGRAVRIRQEPHIHAAKNKILRCQRADKLIFGLVRIRAPKQLCRWTCSVTLAPVLAVPAVNLKRQLRDTVRQEINYR